MDDRLLLGLGITTLVGVLGISAYAIKKKKKPNYKLWSSLKTGDVISGKAILYKGKVFFDKITEG